jgi:hypothetical protein
VEIRTKLIEVIDSLKTDKTMKKKVRFSFSNPGSDKTIDKQSIETKRKNAFPKNNRCEYFIPFLRLIESYKRIFMELKPEDMIYNSKEIKNGELKAIDLFLRMNIKIFEANPLFEIEDLISDDFFQTESLKEIYDTVMDDFITENIEGEKKGK